MKISKSILLFLSLAYSGSAVSMDINYDELCEQVTDASVTKIRKLITDDVKDGLFSYVCAERQEHILKKLLEAGLLPNSKKIQRYVFMRLEMRGKVWVERLISNNDEFNNRYEDYRDDELENHKPFYSDIKSKRRHDLAKTLKRLQEKQGKNYSVYWTTAGLQ